MVVIGNIKGDYSGASSKIKGLFGIHRQSCNSSRVKHIRGEATNDNASNVFDAGGVTALTMYPKQPFDFAGRTGIVAFDISNDNHGTHAAWPEFWMSDLPVPAPFNHFDSWIAF